MPDGRIRPILPQDVPAVVDPSQVDRVGRLVLGWLAP